VGVDDDVLVDEEIEQAVVAEGGADRVEVLGGRLALLDRRPELALDRVALGGDLLDVALDDLGAEGRVGHVDARLLLADLAADVPVHGE
jgi:hypothetical protein